MNEPETQVDPIYLGKLFRAILPVPDGVYSPSDDSFLMLDALSAFSVERMNVLDVGTGSGILGLYCALQKAHVTVSDIDPKALEHTRNAAKTLGVELTTVQSDTFSNIVGEFDLVLFNPPYLVSATFEDTTVDGGSKGIEIASRFMKDLKKHLTSAGCALLLLSNQEGAKALAHDHPEFEFSLAAKRSLFFEELQVLRLKYIG